MCCVCANTERGATQLEKVIFVCLWCQVYCLASSSPITSLASCSQHMLTCRSKSSELMSLSAWLLQMGQMRPKWVATCSSKPLRAKMLAWQWGQIFIPSPMASMNLHSTARSFSIDPFTAMNLHSTARSFSIDPFTAMNLHSTARSFSIDPFTSMNLHSMARSLSIDPFTSMNLHSTAHSLSINPFTAMNLHSTACSLKPVLNWANVCSPNILWTLRWTMIHFLIELLVRRTWFRHFNKPDFILNWLGMRCKLRPKLVADTQQTAWSKMLAKVKSVYFNHPSQGNSTNYYLILGPWDKAAPPTSQQINSLQSEWRT